MSDPSESLQVWIDQNRLSHNEAGRLLGVSASSIGHWLQGHCYPARHRRTKIHEVTGIEFPPKPRVWRSARLDELPEPIVTKKVKINAAPSKPSGVEARLETLLLELTAVVRQLKTR